jgi:hypothetical protein
MSNKIDVVINVYGKPWQTLCTLKSLMINSGHHIDKIFLIKESEQPYSEDIDWIFDYFDNLIVYVPKTYKFTKFNVDNLDDDDRLSVRYQYGFEMSDKKFIFITHNDVLYTGDIIGDMLEKIGGSIGIGQIGQCWNCPAKSMGLCSGESFYEWNPDSSELLKLNLPHIRTNHSNIDLKNPKPLPECRLNEWACLVNRELSNKETYPNGDTDYFGLYGLDLGNKWFKSLHLKNYKFIDYRENFIHCYWDPKRAGGNPVLFKEQLYRETEERAKKHFEDNFK